MPVAEAGTRSLTDAELLLLGLVAEMPRHAYELEREIERRGLREWTRIGFSSVYFVLRKLERAGLVKAKKPAGSKARKTFSATRAGRAVLGEQTLAALGTWQPTHPSLLLGMLHWQAVRHGEAVEALDVRLRAVDAERARLERMQAEQQPLPDFAEAVFDYSIGQLEAEADWIGRTLDYMRTKPRLEEVDG